MKYLNNSPVPYKDNVHLNMSKIDELRVAIVKCEKNIYKKRVVQKEGESESKK